MAELQTHDVVLEAAEFERRFDGCFAGLEAKAQISHEEYSMHAAARLLFAQLGIVPSAGRLDRFIAAYLQDWNSGVKPLPRLNVWMNSLPVCKSVLTNTHQPGFVPDHLERLGIAHLVERVTSSVEHGWRKPDPRIYRDHLAGLGLRVEQVAFVGDDIECDFHGPRSIGMEAYLVAAAPVPGVPESHRLAHLSWPRGLLDDLPELVAFEGQVRHETLVVEHEADDRRACGVGVYPGSCAELDQRDTAIDAGLPTLAGAEFGERVVGHEQNDFRTPLTTKQQAERKGGGPVVLNGLPADQ
ncbi:MAG: HAD family hydrolase [Gammaproteobacteria bacterium]|nr:MAG: HAD family hydrolase [Gammaproteobacteria bacterium]